ncbi:MAG: 23S rRNA (adenine(2030)-N(6))-methyltransferase RlmJ, partial [Afipia sp.]|nr:23S rRNA (adenine(2030)-N(6))-methyltransferase RlmJ [Afipia sp.]
PPNERRGLVLIDPPFESRDEFKRLADGFSAAHAKWPTGIYMLWYPVKERRATDTLADQVARVANAGGDTKCLRVEFSVAPQMQDSGLVSAGLLIINPPWTLAAELKAILHELEKPLGLGGAGRFRVEAVRA